jgi:hypothetical protein
MGGLNCVLEIAECGINTLHLMTGYLQDYFLSQSEIQNLKSFINLRNFILRKGFEFFAILLITLQDPRWPFLHLADDIEGDGIFSEGF